MSSAILTEAEKKKRHVSAARAWAIANPERVRANQRAWAEKNRDKIRAYGRKTRRKLNGAEPTDEQRVGHCENFACNFSGPLHMDHDHATGKTRGWLCGSCNRALGMLKDDCLVIKGLANYLKR